MPSGHPEVCARPGRESEGETPPPSPGVARSVHTPQHHGLGEAACPRRAPTCRQRGPCGGPSQLHQGIRKGLAWGQGEGDSCRCSHHLKGRGRSSSGFLSSGRVLPDAAYLLPREVQHICQVGHGQWRGAEAVRGSERVQGRGQDGTTVEGQSGLQRHQEGHLAGVRGQSPHGRDVQVLWEKAKDRGLQRGHIRLGSGGGFKNWAGGRERLGPGLQRQQEPRALRRSAGEGR